MSVIELAGERFGSKTALAKRIRAILNAGLIGRRLGADEFTLVRALLDRHPDAAEKIGTGIEAIIVDLAAVYRTRCFVIVRTDRTRTDFSYLHCITPYSNAKDFAAACRSAVFDQITAARDAAFRGCDRILCPITGEWIDRNTAHVDHTPPGTFETLLRDFCRLEMLNPEKVPVRGFADGETLKRLVGTDLEERWQKFHRERAQLRVINAGANLCASRRVTHGA